ncbi:MAG: UbiA family prenyltransferase [Candidatus Dormibacteria bacterium]
MTRRTAFDLFRSCHPEPTLAVTALVTVLALRWGRGWGTVWVTLAVLAGQLSVGWGNDYIDRDRDRGRSDKPLASGLVPARLVRFSATASLGVAVALSLASGLLATTVHVAGLGLAHAYNLRLKQTWLSVVCYAVAFAIVPAFVTLGLPAQRLPPAWVMVAAASLGAGAHFTQTLADHDRDRLAGIRGAPQRLGRRGSVLTAGFLLGLAAIVATFGPGPVAPPRALLCAASLALVVGTMVTGLQGRYLASFRLTMGAAAAAVLSLVVGVG